MNNPEETLQQIPIELDHPDWVLERNHTDVQVYSRHGACHSSVVGFKTVTVHPVSASRVFDLLKDVRHAMQLVNNMYKFGKLFSEWPTPTDPNGTLVGTYFNMPFPFTNREFVHGLHTSKPNADTWIVSYTPVEDDIVPAEPGFIRCKTYISGQRITALPDGTCRVEHLMVYELGGAVSIDMQDNWLKAGHVGAYVNEWRNLRQTLFPASVADLNNDILCKTNATALALSQNWATAKTTNGGVVKTGRLPFSPTNAYRLEYTLPLPINAVTDLIGNQSLQYLPQWNKEFVSGDILQTLEDSADVKAWIMRVRYSTPMVVDNREYIYHFSVTKLADNEVMINYQSVATEAEPPEGYTRAILYPSVHHLVAKGNKTVVTHILATNLQGKLGSRQDRLLRNGLINAQIRDIKSQLKLAGKMAQTS